MVEYVQQLKERVALVAGGAAGIGCATARLFAHEGARVAFLDLDETRGRRLELELTQAGAEAVFYPCNVTRREQVEGAVELALARFGQIDILVNVVGGSETIWFWEMTEEDWDTMIEFNLKSAFLCCRAVVPHMMERRQGSIVSLSSAHGAMPAPQRSHYSAAKAGIIGLTRTLAHELAPHGIRVNAVAPGATASERVRSKFDDEGWERLNQEQILGRVSEPEDMAEAILFLASDRGRQITGQVLHVNAGELMP